MASASACQWPLQRQPATGNADGVPQVLQSAWRAVGIEVTIRNGLARTLFGETLKKRQCTGLAMYT